MLIIIIYYYYSLISQEGRLGLIHKLSQETKLPTYLHTPLIIQDLSWYEDRPPDQVHCHKRARQLPVLPDCWRALPRHLTGPKQVEDSDWFPGLFATQLRQRRCQCHMQQLFKFQSKKRSCWVTKETVATPVIPESGLVQQGIWMMATRVGT